MTTFKKSKTYYELVYDILKLDNDIHTVGLHSQESTLNDSYFKKYELMLFVIKNYVNIYNYSINIVEFGSGIGSFLRNLYANINFTNNNNGNITGNRRNIDRLYSYEECSYLTSKNNLINFDYNCPVSIYNRKYTETLFEDSFLSLVVSQDDFYKVTEKNKLFTEIYRILRLRGFLIFSDYFVSDDISIDDRKNLCEIFNVETMVSINEYISIAESCNLVHCNTIFTNSDVIEHFSEVLVNLEDYENLDKDLYAHFKNLHCTVKNLIQTEKLNHGILIFKKTH